MIDKLPILTDDKNGHKKSASFLGQQNQLLLSSKVEHEMSKMQ